MAKKYKARCVFSILDCGAVVLNVVTDVSGGSYHLDLQRNLHCGYVLLRNYGNWTRLYGVN